MNMENILKRIIKTNNMNNYKYFDTTADIGIEVNSDNLENAFKQSALATFNLITDIEKIENNIINEISIESEDEYALLYDWITELLILLDSENFIASEYDINIDSNDDGYKLTGKIYGDEYNTNKYNYKTEVKAITYHKMEINLKNDIKIRFIVDL